jgi:hypothetical protein
MNLVDVTQPPCHRCHVDRGVATADHHDTLADMAQTTIVEGLQEGSCRDHIGCIRAVHRQCTSSLGTQTQKDGVEVGTNLCHGDVGTNAAIEPCAHTQIQNTLNFCIQYIARCAESGNAVAHHAAQFGALVKQGHSVTLQRKLVSSGKSSRATANHRNGFS